MFKEWFLRSHFTVENRRRVAWYSGRKQVICSLPDVLEVPLVSQTCLHPNSPQTLPTHLSTRVAPAWGGCCSCCLNGYCISSRSCCIFEGSSTELTALNFVFNNRIERCLRMIFSIFIVSQLTKKAFPYLGLDNQVYPTRATKWIWIFFWRIYRPNNALSTIKMCTVNIS